MSDCPVGLCQVCNGEIPRKSHESNNRYAGKKFCSQICFRKYMKDNKKGWFKGNSLLTKLPRQHWNNFDTAKLVFGDKEADI